MKMNNDGEDLTDQETEYFFKYLNFSEKDKRIFYLENKEILHSAYKKLQHDEMMQFFFNYNQ